VCRARLGAVSCRCGASPSNSSCHVCGRSGPGDGPRSM
jgi:hypothetical protein